MSTLLSVLLIAGLLILALVLSIIGRALERRRQAAQPPAGGRHTAACMRYFGEDCDC